MAPTNGATSNSKSYVAPLSKVICRPCCQGKTYLFLRESKKKILFFLQKSWKMYTFRGKVREKIFLIPPEP